MKELSLIQKIVFGGIVIIVTILGLVGFESSFIIGISILVALAIAAIIVVFTMQKKSVSGIESFLSKRSFIDPAWWEQFYSEMKNPKEVFLMGQSIAKAFNNPKQTKAFVRWCNNGVKMRIMFLSPENAELSQLQNVGKEMILSLADDPTENLKMNIYNTINSLEELVISKVNEIDKKPRVRYATRDLPYSIMAVDEEMVVTLYGTGAEGDDQSTLFINKGKQSDAYRSFKNEFERIWSKHSKVYPYEDPIVKEYKKDWKKYISLRNFDANVPPPRQAIIFPTYRCIQNCSYCMYKNTRNNDEYEEIKPQFLKNILLQLIDFEVKHIEISGGGEPLEHLKADEIIAFLEEIRREHTDIKLGLLTNGVYLENYDSQRLLFVFNDYIRVSRYEKLGENVRESELYKYKWKKNINSLLNSKRNNTSAKTKIGIKYLLTPNNQNNFVQILKEDLNDINLSGVEHFRFTSDRRMEDDKITEIEQQIYYMITSANLPNFNQTVSISLPNLAYPRNFRCWLSPMNVVIAPDGAVYICCNYLYDKTSKCLGKINPHQDFKSIWRSNRHLELRKKLNRVNCDRNEYSNCRYAKIQNIFERIALTAGI